MLFLTSAFLCGLWYLIAGEPVKTVTSCLSGGNSKVLCVCDPREMIHIINVLYQTATDNCQTVDGQCQLLQESSQEGLIPRCNGQQVCNETISDFKVKQQCGNFTASFVTLTFECIAEQPINFCEETAFSLDIVYLSTPEYGGNSTAITPKQRCECDVSGTNMIVEILELQFDFNQTNKDKLTLTGDNSSWSSVSHVLVYNQVVLNNSDNLRLEYESKGKSRHIMWIRIKGSQNATVSCNIKTNKTSSTSAMSTTTQSSSTAAAAAAFISTSPISLSHSAPAPYTPTTLMHAQKDSSNTTAVAVGSVFAVLILVAVVIAIVLIMMRRKRMKSCKSSNDRLDAAYYSQPDSTNDLHAYEMSLAAMDASEGPESDVSSPTTPHYFVLEPFARQQCSGEEEKIEARKSKEGNNSEQKSNLPYTTKRLEELYAKVIPKKFRSTREMREKEMKVKGGSSSSNRKSETSLNGNTGNDVEVNTARNKRSTKQSRSSSSKSDHDYQEIDTLTPPSQEIDTLTPQSQEIDTLTPPSDSVFTPPVPPKMYDIHDNKVPDESEAKNSKSQTIKSGNKAPKESDRKGKSRSNKDTRESVVMVDNILYEGSPKDKMKYPSSEDEKMSETGSAVSNKQIGDGDASAATAATNGDKNRVNSGREQLKDDYSQRNPETRTHHVDELVMVDNVLYEGNSGDKDGRKNKRTSSRTLSGHEYEDVCEPVSSKPSLTSVKRTMNSPYEDITM